MTRWTPTRTVVAAIIFGLALAWGAAEWLIGGGWQL